MFTNRIALIFGGLLTAGAVALVGTMSAGATKAPEGPQLAHTVYFKLKDSSGANRAKLTASCKLYLSDHPGTVAFATGTLAGDLNAQFNDRDFDVALYMVFVNKEAHDKYQTDPRHVKFVEENLPNLEKVRVFDTYLSPALPGAGRRGLTPQKAS
jgi:hypothetical protein